MACDHSRQGGLPVHHSLYRVMPPRATDAQLDDRAALAGSSRARRTSAPRSAASWHAAHRVASGMNSSRSAGIGCAADLADDDLLPLAARRRRRRPARTVEARLRRSGRTAVDGRWLRSTSRTRSSGGSGARRNRPELAQAADDLGFAADVHQPQARAFELDGKHGALHATSFTSPRPRG